MNNSLASAYVKALDSIAENYGLSKDYGASFISRFPDVLVVKKAEEDEERIWQLVRSVTDEALEKFVAMRSAEEKNYTMMFIREPPSSLRAWLILNSVHLKRCVSTMINLLSVFMS